MASTTAPASLLGKASRERVVGLRTRLAAVARRTAGVRQHLLTVAALGCADTAAFLHSPLVGLLATAASLLVLDYKIQG